MNQTPTGPGRPAVNLLDVVDATLARLLGDDPVEDIAAAAAEALRALSLSAHAEALSRVAQAITEAGTGWIAAGDDITDGDDAAAMVIADGGATCLLVCIPVPAAMTARAVGEPSRPVRIRVDTELAVDLAELTR